MKPGYGTIDNPMDLEIALGYMWIKSGHNIYLRGGVYYGDFVCNLAGAADEPIIIQPYPGETVIIDGDMKIGGRYTTWKNIVFRWSGWATRQSQILDGSDMTTKGFTISGPGTRIINCVIRNFYIPWFTESAVGAEMYGNLICYSGYRRSNGAGSGHNLYTQNGDGRKVIKHNIFHSAFNWNIHAYTEGGRIDNFDVVQNVCFRSGVLTEASFRKDGILIGGTNGPAIGCVVNGNLTYDNRTGFLEYGDGVSGLAFDNNYMPDGVSVNEAHLSSNTGNTIGVVGDQVFVHPNDYQTDRANVTIYNEAQAASVTVDLSAVAGLAAGDSVTVRNVQDYFVDIQTLTLDANKQITVDMQAANRTVAAPVAWTAPPTTFPTFGAFIVEKVSP
jgi:hypothetical protein